jgi:SAM-dependent methyltransferase
MGIEMKAAFTRIYEDDHWGGGSGTGSRPENNVEYAAFLTNFLRSNRIASVVDFGCGDWSFSKFIDWSNISYLGLDIVKSVIDRSNANFGAENISFRLAESLFDLPPAELLICKDVLQHLPNREINEFLAQAKRSYKWLLITNDDYPSNNLNSDILPGQWRALDLTSPPFSESAATILSWVVISDTPTVRKRTCLIPSVGNCLDTPAVFLEGKEKPAHESHNIPARIFQTWKSKHDLPENYTIWSQTFSLHNPSFERVLWDDDDNLSFITEKFPWFLETYQSYPREIYRADAIRYFFLYAIGGIYADMDVECLRPLDSLLSQGDVVLGRMGSNPDSRHSIPNAIMASTSRQEFWLLVIWLLMDLAKQGGYPEYVTGPVVLKTAVDLYLARDPRKAASAIQTVAKQLPPELQPMAKRSTVVVLPSREWFALDWTDPIHQILRGQVLQGGLLPDDQKNKLFPESSMVTYWTHNH